MAEDDAPSEGVRKKAHAYLEEGRIRPVSLVPPEVIARGSGKKPYRVRFRDGTWQCTCPSRQLSCAHAVAAGWIMPTPDEAGEVAPSPAAGSVSLERNAEIDALLGDL